MAQKMTQVQVQGVQGGKVLSDGVNWLSCEPNGKITTVPNGTLNPSVYVAINGNLATYNNVDVYNFPFVQDIPNHPGWSGIYLIAL